MVGLPELVEMRIEEFAVVGVDHFVVLPLADTQPGRLDAPGDFAAARPISSGLAMPSSQTTCTARSTRSSSPSAKTMRLGDSLGLGEDRLHDHAGVVDEFVEALDM